MMYKLVFFFNLAVICAGIPVNNVKSNSRIVGGENAEEGAYPYQASIRSTFNVHYCGCTIITDRTVLTAGHCVDGYYLEFFRIVVGTNHIASPGIAYSIIGAIIHPDYDYVFLENDIALVMVSTPITFSPTVQPIAINENFIQGDVPVILTGWGKTSHPGDASTLLQVITLKTLKLSDCRNRLTGIGRVFDSSICTLTKYGEGACHGDSGSPLVADNKIVGIVSWGSACALGYPDVFARVSYYAKWINENKQ